jgi:hypothetical protein
MTRIRLGFLSCVLIILAGMAVLPAAAQGGIRVINNEITLSFPETATFKAQFQSDATINSIVLEYGVDQLTCGNVIGKSFPDFTTEKQVQVEWSWDMRQSGSLPPGASIWWQWKVQDDTGNEFTSPIQTRIWLDDLHGWQVIEGGNISLHYYEGGSTFGQTLHDGATQALDRLVTQVGIQPTRPVDIYIYATTDDLKAAILYEPSWIGGQAFPEYNIVIIGISPDELDWGLRTEGHELTHVLVGQSTFTCLGFIPTWLNEGLAMVGEGGIQTLEQSQFDAAVQTDQLLSLRSLAGNFSEESSRATLSYSESFSVVNYLVTDYGQQDMKQLLEELQNGIEIDQALQDTYGFNTDGLEDAWRASIHAAPRAGVGNLTSVATPTLIPTLLPLGEAPQAGENPLPVPTIQAAYGMTSTATQTGQASGGRLAIGALIAIMACCAVLLVIVIVVIVIAARQKSKRQP